MPPRRSSRAPSAAVEPPTQAAEPLPGKRKRGQSGQPSRARSSRASTSKSGTSARSRGHLPDVVESGGEEGEGEEEEAAPPAKKKARPSVKDEVKVEEDEDSEAEEQPSKGKGRVPASRNKRDSSIAVDEPVELPKRRSRQASTGAPRRPSVTTTSRTARKGRVVSVADSVPEEDEEMEEEPQPKRAGRGASKAAKEEPVSEPEGEAESDEEGYDEDPAPKARKGKGKASTRQTKAPAKKAQKKVVVVGSDEEDEDELIPPPPAQPKASTSKPRPTEEPEPEEDEPEETSLFEPVPMPDPANLPKFIPEEPKGPQTRLVISKMALINFKSYAGRQEIGPFHKSFSAIVGPNGSGKSNTIDALLFVFGYRASKMRQGKVSELIHNSARYPDLEECSVEVHFRDIVDLPGPDAYEVVPGSKLVVSRTAYKNNSSKYTINGKSSSYKEVQALLKGRGIDLDHNRFLILQGEVESIAQMKPKAPSEHEDGLLEYLEDIIGTFRFKEPIDEAMVEVEQYHEERQVKMNRLRLVEKEKMALEEARREAINFYKLKNDHIRALSRYYQWYIFQLLETQTKSEHRMAKLEAELEKEKKANEEELAWVEKLKEHFAVTEKKFQELTVKTEASIKDLREMEKKDVNAKERHKHAKTRKKKLEKSVQEDSTALRNAQNLITDSTERLEKAAAALEQYNDSLAEAEAELDKIQEGLRGKTERFHKLIKEKQKELEPWTTKIDAKQTQLDVAQSERDTLVQRAEAVKRSVDEAEESLANLRSEQEEKLQAQSECKAQKEQLKKQIAAATQKQQSAQTAVNEWRGKASSSRNRLDEAKANQSQNRSRNALLESLTNLKVQGRLQGFHGKLGDLGTIPDKYDVAISTAAGGSLANLVVDKVEQGKMCIEYLRTNNLGRASFMILEKFGDQAGMRPIQTPEGVPRLFDLIKPKDAMYRKAFYKAVGDTLVAENTEQASRIAFGAGRRYRVVTLAGNLIETSGAMSGGGAQPQRGAMNSRLVTEIPPETVREYERDSEAAAAKLQKALKDAHDADTELEKLQKTGPELDMSYQKLTLEIETRKARITEAAKRAQELKTQNKPNAGDQARIKDLDKQIASSTSDLDKLQREADKIQEAIKELEKEILKIGGAKLMTQKSAVDGLRNHINLTNDAIAKAETEKNKAVNDVKRLTTTVATNKEQLTEVLEELEKVEQELYEIDEYLGELKKIVETAQSESEGEKETLDGLTKDMKKAEAGLAEFKQTELRVTQEIGDIVKELATLEDAIADQTERHDSLKLHDIEEEAEDSDDEDEEADNPDEEPSVKPDPDAARPEKRAGDQLRVYKKEELRGLKRDELLADTELLDEKIKNSKVDLTVLKEYKKQQALFDNRAKELEDITKLRDEKKAHYDGLRKQRLEEFMSGFNLISLKLKEMYQMITLGGNAELELVDSMDPFSEGIIFSVMPPKKSWKNISNLSGGEKTLSSLALVFALHVFKPTPLYFMDEIDAALDFRNVSIVANYIKDRTKNAQFIIISLRNDMFELSHRLIGIYKTSNATRSISIDNHKLLTTVPQATNATT